MREFWSSLGLRRVGRGWRPVIATSIHLFLFVIGQLGHFLRSNSPGHFYFSHFIARIGFRFTFIRLGLAPQFLEITFPSNFSTDSWLA